jgi:hypothetical protein
VAASQAKRRSQAPPRPSHACIIGRVAPIRRERGPIYGSTMVTRGQRPATRLSRNRCR